jgi:hypothetical protein
MSRTCRRTCEDVEHLLPPPQWEPAWGLLLWDRMRRRSVRGARFRGVRLCVHDRSRHRDQVKLDAMHLRSGLARTFQAMQLRLRLSNPAAHAVQVSQMGFPQISLAEDKRFELLRGLHPNTLSKRAP